MDAINNSQQSQNHTARNTVIGAGIGAGINAGYSAHIQKNIIKEKDAYINNAKDLKESGEVLIDGVKVTKDSWLGKNMIKNGEIAEAGKMSGKILVKAGAIGAAIVGGVTLLVNLVKNRKPKEE